MRQLQMLPDDSAGRVIKAAACLFVNGREPEDLDLSEQIVFSLLRDNIQDSLAKFADTCQRNRKIAEKRTVGARAETGGDEPLPGAANQIESNQTESNQKEKNKKESNKAAKPARARFVPPTLEEVRTYCIERGNAVDAQRFLDYYTANGWVQGREKPIRDWKAAVRTWERSEQEKAAVPDMSWRTERPRWEADAQTWEGRGPPGSIRTAERYTYSEGESL